MFKRFYRTMLPVTLVCSLILILFSAKGALAAETKGTLTYSKGSVVLKYSYLIKGPDSFDNKKIFRRLIFSGSDIAAKIQACTTMSCVDGTITDGLMVYLDQGSRLNYWMAVGNAMTQYSGSKDIAALKTSAEEPKRVAGHLSIDDSAASGPKIDVEFDAALVKEFSQAR